MSEPGMVGCYQHVKRPYEDVAARMRRDPLDLLQRATTTASARARSLATSLRVEVAGLEICVDVRLYVRRVRDKKDDAGASPGLCLDVTWEALKNPALFPSMLAELSVWPVSECETQIDFKGAYWAPMGPLGAAIDAALGHRIAEAAVHRFLEDLVEQLRSDLPALEGA